MAMVSLSTTVARDRAYYPQPLLGLPDILMIRLPEAYWRSPRPLGRYYPIFVETIGEQEEVESFLDADRGAPAPPDIFDERPSILAADHITLVYYGPPAPRWPYVLLCRWPADLAAAAFDDTRMFARGVYTFDLFSNHDELESATEALLASLQRRRALAVEIGPPDWSAPAIKARH
jgi:hypothetical protein